MKQLVFFLICCVILICMLPSCGNDSPPTNTNQNTGTNTTPIGTPNGPPVTATIGSSGGSITALDSSFEIIIPAGALSSNTDITVQSLENFCYNGNGNAYRLSPDGLQFNQPITINFHYNSEILQNTYDILMGIARQDASGHWHDLNDITNDTVNGIISASITHFGLSGDNNTGGGDVSFFDIAHLEPRSGEIGVNKSLNMTVTYTAIPGEGDDELYYLPKPIHSWYVNGIQNGNSTVGTIINRQGQTSTYRAPAQVPSPNTVTVGALINTRVNRRGRVIEQFTLQSQVKIIQDSLSFDLKIKMVWPDFDINVIEYHCTFSDSANMIVNVKKTQYSGTLTLSNIANKPPNAVPPSGNYSQGQVVWITDGKGLINITGIDNYNIYGDDIYLELADGGSVLWPKFQFIPTNGQPYYSGGNYVYGFPRDPIHFLFRDEVQTIPIEDGHITVTLTPRH